MLFLINMIPITKPTLSKYKKYAPRFKEVIESGILTNGKYVKLFEDNASKYLGVKYCIAVSSCTSGLMLVLKGLAVRGEVVLPSFTFSASGHAVLWNNLKPVFADIKKDTYEIDPISIKKMITPKTGAILATQIFGNSCNVAALRKICNKHNLRLIFDAAHAFGSELKGKKVGVFGDAEVFSLSPTKVLTAAEGGLIATNNKALAEFCRIGRNYGDDGSYNTKFNGLNARMSEFHAIIGLESLKNIDKNLKDRLAAVNYFKNKLSRIDKNIEFQAIHKNSKSTFKDFSLYINPSKTGYNRDQLHDHLITNGIIAKKYFYPPLHLQKTYNKFYVNKKQLVNTNNVANNVLSLPLFSHISKKEIDLIVETIKTFYDTKRI